MVENNYDLNESNVSYYDEYIKKILEVASLSTKENSVLISLNIEDGRCESSVELLEHNGDKTVGKSVTFACTQNFYKQFLEKLVVKYAAITSIVVTDIIDIDGDSQYTFRIVGENNDMFSVDGISKDYAKLLKEKVSNKENKSKVFVKTESEAGMSNVLGLSILVSLFLVIFLTLLVFIW